MRAALRSVQPPFWLAGIVCASFAALALEARSIVHPITFADELIYSGAAKRLALGQGPAPSGEDYGYGLVFPSCWRHRSIVPSRTCRMRTCS